MNTKLISIFLETDADVNRPELDSLLRTAAADKFIEPVTGLFYIKTTYPQTYFLDALKKTARTGRYLVMELTAAPVGEYEAWVADWFKNHAQAA